MSKVSFSKKEMEDILHFVNNKSEVVETLSGGSYLPVLENESLRDIKFLKPGVYCCSSTTTAETLADSPTATSFLMVVKEIGNAHREATQTWMYRFRTIMDINGNVWFQKTYTAGTTEIQWGEWLKVATQTMIPATSSIAITPPANGGSYTPTENGWLSFKGTASAGGFVELGTWASNGLETRSVASSSGGGVAVFLPVRKGDVCYFYYNGITKPSAVLVKGEVF